MEEFSAGGGDRFCPTDKCNVDISKTPFFLDTEHLFRHLTEVNQKEARVSNLVKVNQKEVKISNLIKVNKKEVRVSKSMSSKGGQGK